MSIDFVIVLVLLYFAPTIFAMVLGEDPLVIFLVNLFFGWTVIGWGVAMIWAFTERGTFQAHNVHSVPVSSGRFCSGCGAAAASGARVCPNCGRPV